MPDNQTLGKEGEELACQFLQGKGYLILEKNYRYKKAEVDIIAKKDKILAFVEVKLRTSTLFGFPEHAVTEQKKRQFQQAAEHYLESHSIENLMLRFDIISILKTSHQTEIMHLEDVFE